MARARPTASWRPLLALLAVVLVIGLAAVALAWRHASGDHAGGAACHAAEVTAQLELAPADTTAQPVDLAKAADILARRLSTYGCRSKVTVSGDRLHVAAGPEALPHLDALSAAGDLQFREVLEARAAGQCLPVTSPPPPTAPITACAQNGSEEYELAPARLGSSDVEGAAAQRDQQLGEWQVIVHFTHHGQQAFTSLTEQLVSKRMAMVLDGVVISAPTIQERITGDAQITGSFTEASAKDLAAVLSYGPLPVRLHRA